MERTFKAKGEMSGLIRVMAVVMILAGALSFTLSFFNGGGWLEILSAGFSFVTIAALAVLLVGSARFTYAVGDEGLKVSTFYWKRVVPYAEVDLTTGGRFGVLV